MVLYMTPALWKGVFSLTLSTCPASVLSALSPRVEGLRLEPEAKPSSRESALRRGSQHGKGTKHIQDA